MEVWAKLIYPNVPDDVNRFEISTSGRIRNKNNGKILKQCVLSSGYCSVRTTIGNKGKIHIIVHRAVAYTFIPNPHNLPEVNHKDGNRTNNSVLNLEWCTSHDNQQHKYDIGIFDKNKISGENNHAAKLTWDAVRYIRKNYKLGSKQFGARALAKKFNISSSTMKCLLDGKTWKE